MVEHVGYRDEAKRCFIDWEGQIRKREIRRRTRKSRQDNKAKQPLTKSKFLTQCIIEH